MQLRQLLELGVIEGAHGAVTAIVEFAFLVRVEPMAFDRGRDRDRSVVGVVGVPLLDPHLHNVALGADSSSILIQTCGMGGV